MRFAAGHDVILVWSGEKISIVSVAHPLRGVERLSLCLSGYGRPVASPMGLDHLVALESVWICSR